MSVWRGLASRIALLGSIGALLSIAVYGYLTVRGTMSGAAMRLGRALPGPGSPAWQACARAPAAWPDPRAAILRLDSLARFDAYDGTTLRSAQPGAEPLDLALLAEADTGSGMATRPYLAGGWSGVLVRRVAATGPCAVFQIKFKPDPAIRSRATVTLLGSGAIVGLLFAVGMVAVVYGLVTRLRRLRQAAAHVGRPEAWRSAADAHRDELGELSRLLDAAHARIVLDEVRLQGRGKALEQHLADIAHDLRTPIASAQIALEQATRLAAAQPELAGLLTTAVGELVYLATLSENLRLAARLDHDLEPLDGAEIADLGAVVDQTVVRGQLLGRLRQVRVAASRPDEVVRVACPATLLEPVLASLVQDAVASGHPGGHVAVSLDRLGGDRFRLQVADDSPREPPDALPRLGARTFRSDDARQRGPAGQVLGWAVCAELCARAAWRLTVTRGVPRGVTVTIEGPLAATPSQAPGTTRPPRHSRPDPVAVVGLGSR